jgi:hypothetical protein
MKRIYSMGKGKYVTLDSYNENHGTRAQSIGIALLSLLLAAVTGAALVGVDITKVNPSVQPSTQPSVNN